MTARLPALTFSVNVPVLKHCYAPRASVTIVCATTVALLMGACSADGTDPSTPTAGPTRASTSSPSTTERDTNTARATSTPSGGSGAASSPQVAAVRTANRQLTDSLYALVQSLKTLQADNTLSEARRALSTAATGARKAVKVQRSAAYPSSTRQCTTVRAAAATVKKFTSQGATARTSVSTKVAKLNTDISSLDAVTTQVTSAQKALAASLKGLSNPPATVATTEVLAAIKEAAARRAEVTSAVKAVTSASTEAGKTFDKINRQSATIATDACS